MLGSLLAKLLSSNAPYSMFRRFSFLSSVLPSEMKDSERPCVLDKVSRDAENRPSGEF